MASGCRYGYDLREEGLSTGGSVGGAEPPGSGGDAPVGGGPATGGTNWGGGGGDDACSGSDCFPDTPIIDASLMLWLDATDGGTLSVSPTLSQWRDKSARGNDVEQLDSGKQPSVVPAAIHGLAAVRFDGVDDSLFASNSDGRFDAEELSVFLVVSPEWLIDPLDNPAPLAIRGNNSGETRISFHVSGSNDNFQNFNGIFQQFSPVSVPPGVPQFLEFSFERVDPVVMLTEHHLNGRLTNTDNDNSFGPLLQPLRVGAAQDDYEHFEGLVAEVLVYDRPLSDAERQEVEDYIEKKWGIAMER